MSGPIGGVGMEFGVDSVHGIFHEFRKCLLKEAKVSVVRSCRYNKKKITL